MTNGEYSPYRLLAVVSETATSTVCAAEDPRTGRIVAIKRLPTGGERTRELTEQLRNERRASEIVAHPAVRKTHELRRRGRLRRRGVELIMEFVDGWPLSQRTPPTLHKLVGVFAQCAAGLDAMHRASLAHADLRPEHILVDVRGRARIIDLGRAVSIGRTVPIGKEKVYLSPEQIKGRPYIAASDVFLLGAVLYRCLTGRTIPKIFTITDGRPKVLKDYPLAPPAELHPNLPFAVNQVVLDCLNLRPRLRIETMADLADRLEIALTQVDPDQPVAPLEPHDTQVL